MKNSIPNLTAERLRELLHYDPHTGVFTRLKAVRRFNVGDIAGGVNVRGYRQTRVFGKIYLEHRLAWLYIYGVWPTHEIDHINGDKANNCLSNLRQATSSENKQNIRVARIDNKSGLLGAHWNPRRSNWFSQIKVNGINHYLGSFVAADLAHAKYLRAKAVLHRFGTLNSHIGSMVSA